MLLLDSFQEEGALDDTTRQLLDLGVKVIGVIENVLNVLEFRIHFNL